MTQTRTRDVNPLDLELDPDNPRLTLDEEGSDQAELLRIMIERFKIEELAESIIASGYNAFDPIVVWEHDSKLTVLEGNRRLATVQLLLDPGRAPARYSSKWRALSERLPETVKSEIDKLTILIFTDKTDPEVTSYIGFRHVTGVLKWPALEKAKFIAQLIDEHDWDYKQVAERLGSYPKHVERHYVAYQIVRQVREDRLPGSGSLEDTFGVLLRALQATGVSEFLGVDYPGDPTQSVRPVPDDHTENLKDFLLWGFGTEDQTRILPDSRRLTDFGKILQSKDAVSYMRRTKIPSFERAFFKSGGQSGAVQEWLLTASDRLEEAVPLVPEHVEDPNVVDAVSQVAKFFAQIVGHFPGVRSKYRLGGDDD